MSRTVLMVSKPVAPPWTDSSKNLVRDLSRCGERYRYRVLTPRGRPLDMPNVASDPVYSSGGRFSPALAQNARVLARLLRRDRTSLANFFFAPNPRSSSLVRLALRLRPRPAIQTVCSTPKSFENAEALLFGQRVVVLSRHTRRRFERAGVAPGRLVQIPPAICPPAPPTARQLAEVRRRYDLPPHRKVVVYPGDYQFSSAAQCVARAAALMTRHRPVVVFACRAKQAESLAIERDIRRLLGRRGLLSRVRMVGEVAHMPSLLAACDLCLLPAESLYAKMDLPLVLLEAMALGVPLVVGDGPPLNELLDDDVGSLVTPGDAAQLARVTEELLDRPERRREMGRNGRAAVERRYSAPAVARRYEQLYDELLADVGPAIGS